MNKKNSFSDSGYFRLRLPPTLCWRTRRLSTAWNKSTRLTSTKRPPSSASWGYWRRRMSPSLKRDPQGSDTPPPHWSMAVQQMFCDIDTVPDKRRICRIYSVIWTLFLHSMMTCDVELCLLCNSLWTLLLLTLFITVLCIDIFVSALENVRRE